MIAYSAAELAAAVIVAGAREVHVDECLSDRRRLHQVMYYPEIRYRHYLQAAQRLHPIFGGTPEQFEVLREAKHTLDFWQASGEGDLSWVGASASKTTA